MVDILKELLKNLNIEVSYTNNKVLILSCDYKSRRPFIRAHKIFRECSEEIAYAIIYYYTKSEKREENLKIVKAYADKNFNSQSYKITPPNEEFYKEVVETIMSVAPKQDEKLVLVEMDISSMTKKDFYGDEYTVNTNESLRIDEDDIMEVNITVNPFNT